MTESRRLNGKTAIVSGASSGIGEAIAHHLAAEGVNLVVTARRTEKLESVAAAINARGKGSARAVRADVTVEADVDSLFEQAHAHLGRLDLLVNVAGVAKVALIEDMTHENWRLVIDTCLTSVFFTGRAAFRIMKPQQRGRIISIGSISAKSPRPGTVAYVAAKFGLDGMTRAMALEGRAFGITCTVLHPGVVATEFGPDAAAGPGRTCLDVNDVARMVVLAADLPDEASWLDATVFPIDQPFLGRG